MKKTEMWGVYIIECKNGELYVGIAKDVDSRVVLHNKGLACRYTKYRRPVQLVYKEDAGDYSVARKREKQVKGFSRERKAELIQNKTN